MHEGKFDVSVGIGVFSQFSPTITIYFWFLRFSIVVLLVNFLLFGVLGSFILADNKTSWECFFTDCTPDIDFKDSFTSIEI